SPCGTDRKSILSRQVFPRRTRPLESRFDKQSPPRPGNKRYRPDRFLCLSILCLSLTKEWSVMSNHKHRMGSIGFLVMFLATGCSSSKGDKQPTAEQEGAVHAKFTELQAAVKSHDADRIWKLLDSKSQADAERAAK